MCIYRSARQLFAAISSQIVHAEHHQLTHTNKAHRIAARSRVRDQRAEARYQLDRARTLWGPGFHSGVEV